MASASTDERTPRRSLRSGKVEDEKRLGTKRKKTSSIGAKKKAKVAKRKIDQVNQLMISRWPAAMLRFDYDVIPRTYFDNVSFLAKGGLGVVLSARAKPKYMKSVFKKGCDSPNVVFKSVLDPKDWNNEISGYHCNRDNPYVVSIVALVLMSARECNRICEKRKGFIKRPEGSVVPMMIFEKWDGALDDAIDDGLVPQWGLLNALTVLICVARATSILHKAQSMHRDINPANIFYREVENDVVVAALGDLGLCKNFGPETRAGKQRLARTRGCGTDGFMAPELKSGPHYSHPADIYSFAITVERTIRAAIARNRDMDEDLKELIIKGKSDDPDQRPTADEFLEQLLAIKKKFIEAEEDRERVRQRSGLRARSVTKKKNKDFAYLGTKEAQETKEQKRTTRTKRTKRKKV